MNRVDELTEQLKKAISESKENIEYQQLYEKIKTMPDVKRSVDQIRKENFLLLYSDNVDHVLEKTQELRLKYKDIRLHPYVDEFLTAEMCLNRMIQSICINIADAVDFDTTFLNDN